MPRTVPIAAERQMLESLRESEFDCFSAYGEVIDNSIQAGATFCKIRVETTIPLQKGTPYERIEEMAFGDDGCGMDEETLHQCLSLGWSSRFGDRNGIGRFGVGMTLGAIHEVRRVEVYSRTKGSNWRHVYLDLDELATTPEGAVGIQAPTARSLPDKYKLIVGQDSGTVVVWSKYDRQPSGYGKLKPNIEHWAGRTFRKFIWHGFAIDLDGSRVHAFDPLFHETRLTRFPNDPKSNLLGEMELTWPVPVDERRGPGMEDSKIIIRMSLLPEEWRRQQGLGGSAHAKERRIDENEGISILRKGREVFYDHVPHWPGGAAEDVDRWWSCEIEFEPNLDRAFSVKNIKRGAVPNPELKLAIYEKIRGTIKDCRQRIRAVYAQTKADSQRSIQASGTGHEIAQAVARDTKVAGGVLFKGKDQSKESDKAIDSFLQDRSHEERARLKALFASQPFTIADGRWAGPHFMEVSHLGGSDLITYNLQHPFTAALYEKMRKIEKDGGTADDMKWLRASVDLLLMAYAKSESMLDPKGDLPPETLLETLRLNWGQYLKEYTRTWTSQQGSELAGAETERASE